MKKMISALSIFAALGLSACAHGGHHGSCCGDECKMDSTKTAKHSCCGGSDECDMKNKKTASETTTDTTKK